MDEEDQTRPQARDAWSEDEDGRRLDSVWRRLVAFGALLRIYALDWLTAIAVLAIGGLPQVLVEPNEASWSVADFNYYHEGDAGRKDSLVPSTILMIVVFPVCLGVIILVNFPLPGLGRHFFNIRELHHALLGHLFAVFLSSGIQGTISVTAGGLRPDFFAVCDPDPATPPGVQPVCRSTDSDAIESGRRSFPCGHCSFSTSAGAFVTLYLMAVLHVWSGKSILWRLVASLIPLQGALLISVTRITDGRHHPGDVAVGILIGLFTATVSYFYFFCGITGKARGLPRCVRDSVGMPRHLTPLARQAPFEQPCFERPVPSNHQQQLDADSLGRAISNNGGSSSHQFRTIPNAVQTATL